MWPFKGKYICAKNSINCTLHIVSATDRSFTRLPFSFLSTNERNFAAQYNDILVYDIVYHTLRTNNYLVVKVTNAYGDRWIHNMYATKNDLNNILMYSQHKVAQWETGVGMGVDVVLFFVYRECQVRTGSGESDSTKEMYREMSNNRRNVKYSIILWWAHMTYFYTTIRLSLSS